MASKKEDVIGKTFGHLTVEYDSGKKTKNGTVLYTCICICGTPTIVTVGDLKRGNTKSCGKCDIFNKHGMSYTSTYASWKCMMQRCYNPKFKQYRNYGGRGVEVDRRWWGFNNFYNDMGEKPQGRTLDKLFFGNYGPLNARWATPQEQNQNSRARGYKYCKKDQKYEARIIVDKQYIHLGCFEGPDDAHQAYLDAKMYYHQADMRPEVVKRLHSIWDRAFLELEVQTKLEATNV